MPEDAGKRNLSKTSFKELKQVKDLLKIFGLSVLLDFQAQQVRDLLHQVYLEDQLVILLNYLKTIFGILSMTDILLLDLLQL